MRSIKTSLSNKEVVTNLTTKLQLGAENVIARIALSLSLSKLKKFDISDIKDSKGKEYTKNIFFGDYYFIYVSCIKTIWLFFSVVPQEFYSCNLSRLS